MDSPPSPSRSSRYIDRSRLVACRECRRSKIRCSRTFPCEACVRRGCTDICPDGIKETKRSKSDESLLQENARLVGRIRQLEEILSSLKYPTALLPRSESPSPEPSSPGQQFQPPDLFSAPGLVDTDSVSHLDLATSSEYFLEELAGFSIGPRDAIQSSQTFRASHDLRREEAASTLYQSCSSTDDFAAPRKPFVSDKDGFGSRVIPPPSPASSSSLSSTSSMPDVAIHKAGIDVDAFDPGQQVWNLPDIVPSAATGNSSSFPSGPPARIDVNNRGRFPSFGLLEGAGDLQFETNWQSDKKNVDDFMSFGLCQRVFVDIDVVGEPDSLYD